VSGARAHLTHLSVRDFRNLEHVELAPAREGFVLVGENGQGKTNLLESIHYLEVLRSARGARDQDLVRFGAAGFHIGASVETDAPHEIGVGFERAGKRKRARVDGVVPERLSDALGALPSVMFSPADVELIAGAPSARRRYLDIMLALTSHGYLRALQSYRGALLRRNAALRDAARGGRDAAARVAIWEPALADHGAVLLAERIRWVDCVEDRFEARCGEIGEIGQVRLRYASALAPGEDFAAALRAALADKRALDLRRGVTHAGPHRDDLAITLDGRELRTFGSAGQQRTAAIALRMLEAETFTERTGRAPLFLLDDPFAELDARRASRILDVLASTGRGQTMLAVPRETEIPAALASLDRLHIADGAITSVRRA
jgi:DNA replication and repair protein RecF